MQRDIYKKCCILKNILRDIFKSLFYDAVPVIRALKLNKWSFARG